MTVNKVILVGNLGKDPETRTFANGGKVVSFSVATDTPWLRRFTRSVTSFSASLRRGPAETHLRFSLPVPGSTPS